MGTSSAAPTARGRMASPSSRTASDRPCPSSDAARSLASVEAQPRDAGRRYSGYEGRIAVDRRGGLLTERTEHLVVRGTDRPELVEGIVRQVVEYVSRHTVALCPSCAAISMTESRPSWIRSDANACRSSC